MFLADFLQRRLLRTFTGALFTSAFGKKRRDILLFEEILANYIRECESKGHVDEIQDLAREWMKIVISGYAPAIIRKLPLKTCITLLLEPLWKNLGIIEQCRATQKDNIVTIKTKGEPFTSFIGENYFFPGLFLGIIEAHSLKQAKLLSSNWKEDSAVYNIGLTTQRTSVELKDRVKYYKLNNPSANNANSLENLIKGGAIKLRGNKIFYKEKRLFVAENSLLHLIGRKRILLDSITSISKDFFEETLQGNLSKTKRMQNAKLIFQLNGFGTIDIVQDRDRLIVKILNPPYGLQAGEENWDFISYYMLGYFKTINPSYQFKQLQEFSRKLLITYALP